jgi:hypothetical protein
MLVAFHQYHQWTQQTAHHHFQPSFKAIKQKLQPNPKKPTKCKKNFKN